MNKITKKFNIQNEVIEYVIDKIISKPKFVWIKNQYNVYGYITTDNINLYFTPHFYGDSADYKHKILSLNMRSMTEHADYIIDITKQIESNIKEGKKQISYNKIQLKLNNIVIPSKIKIFINTYCTEAKIFPYWDSSIFSHWTRDQFSSIRKYG